METQFYILLSLKVADTWEPFGKFFIGNDREEAAYLFSLLEGTEDTSKYYPLSTEFMETVNGLPVNLKVLNCDLAQLAENTVTITKQLFKQRIL
jgi:hypothetical protein